MKKTIDETEAAMSEAGEFDYAENELLEGASLEAINLLPSNKLGIIMEKIQVALKMYVSPAVLDEIVFNQEYDPITKKIVAHFEMYLLSNQIHTETIKGDDVPVTWWDGFKEEYFPRFLKRRFPPKIRQTFTEHKTIHVCPHLNYRTPSEERFHLQFMANPGNISRLGQ
ncbi:hypothetical protein LCGC14_1660340 [marine sediment metagenome]|uniref:Uncharacterized protein n=1 Tax=marine sediment metagenome TaxID=412755 RepID=A0A0F9HUZ3_9ZZZZ